MIKVTCAAAAMFIGLSVAGNALAPCTFGAWTGLSSASSCPKGYCMTSAGCCRLGSGNCSCM